VSVAQGGAASPFEGVWPVLQVPFAADPLQSIVTDELAGLARALLPSGVAGVVVLGLGSEAWKLTEAERDRVVETAVGVAPRVVVGIDGHTAVACERVRRALHPGVVGMLFV
jgi:dihydrodipicolinate synthase/N-acetylneuraminate lyase